MEAKTFSKYGKYLEERFLKENPSKNGLQSKKQNLKSFFKSRKRKNKSVKEIEELFNVVSYTPAARNKRPKSTAAFASQSRESYYRSQGKKTTTPITEYYDCNFSQVNKKVSIATLDHSSPTKSSRATSYSPQNRAVQSFIGREIRHSVDFSKQIDRPEMQLNNAHEGRFISYEIPESYAKFKRVQSPNLKKRKGRSTELNFQTPNHSYCPNYKLVWRSTGNPQKFDCYLGRKPARVRKYCLIDKYDVNYDMLDKKSKSPDFKKSLSRPDNELPCYMSKVNFREGMRSVNYKMLEMNHSVDFSTSVSPKTKSVS